MVKAESDCEEALAVELTQQVTPTIAVHAEPENPDEDVELVALMLSDRGGVAAP